MPMSFFDDDEPVSCGPDPALERVRELCEPKPGLTPEQDEKIMDGLRASISDGTVRTDGGMLRYNNGKLQMSLVPASLGRYTAAVLGYGAIKYSANNWRRGGSWTSGYESLQRHIDLWREGEDYDAESGLPHLAHIAFGVMLLIEFFDKDLGQDDRFRYPGQSKGEELPGKPLTFNQPPKKDAA